MFGRKEVNRPLSGAQVYYNDMCRCYYIKGFDDEGIHRNRPATKSEELDYYGELYARRQKRMGASESLMALKIRYAHFAHGRNFA